MKLSSPACLKIVLAVILLWLLAACQPSTAPVPRPEQTALSGTIPLPPENCIGQTFTAHFDGLQSIQVYLAPGTGEAAGGATLVLRSGPGAKDRLRSAELPASAIRAPGYYFFSFDPLPASTGQDYYACIRSANGANLQVGQATGVSYPYGNLYREGAATDQQLTFNLAYDQAWLARGLAKEAFAWLKYLLLAVLLFVLPGWALLGLLFDGWDTLPWSGKLGLASGVSLALYPILVLWTWIFGLQLGPIYAWLPVAAAVLALTWQAWKRRSQCRQIVPAFGAYLRSPHLWPDLALLGLFALLIFTRLWGIRSIDIPLWGDSLQHTMVTQLIIDRHGLFNDWQPYAELVTFTYHFGFQTLAAVFHWASGLPAPQAVLWTGQIVNILAVIGLIPLAIRLGRSRWSAVVATLVAGLLVSLPMLYVNWGRYTQLAGQAILPAAVFLSWAFLEAPRLPRRSLALVWLCLGGLAVTHYRILIYAMLFVFVWMVSQLWRQKLWPVIVRVFWCGIGALLLFLPWLVHAFAGKLIASFSYHITALPGQGTETIEAYNTIGSSANLLPVLIWLFMALAIAWGLWRHERDTTLVGVWWGLLFIATNPQWLKLPGAGIISNFALFISAYIPAALLLAAAAGWAVELAGQQFASLASPTARKLLKWSAPVLLALVLLGLGLWYAQQRRTEIYANSQALVLRPDLRAAAWIEANLPAGARFLVNSTFAYNNTSVVGYDGGWWLPLLAHRQTTLPPLLYASEEGPRPDYHSWINDLTAQIQQFGLADPRVRSLLSERGVTHIYLGQQHTLQAAQNPQMSPEALSALPFLHLVYHQDQVWIFEVLPKPPPGG